MLPQIVSDSESNVNAKHYVSGCCKYRKVRLLNAGQLELQSLVSSGEGEIPNEKSVIRWQDRSGDKDTNPKIGLRLSGFCQAKKALAEFLYPASA